MTIFEALFFYSACKIWLEERWHIHCITNCNLALWNNIGISDFSHCDVWKLCMQTIPLFHVTLLSLCSIIHWSRDGFLMISFLSPSLLLPSLLSFFLFYNLKATLHLFPILEIKLTRVDILTCGMCTQL